MADKEEKVKADKDRNKLGLLWRILDLFLAYVIIGPFVVFYWRGTWSVMDTYVAPDNHEISGWASTVIGISVALLGSLLQELYRRGTRRMHSLPLTIVTRLYCYVLGFGVVNLWRGVWFLWDHYTGKTALSAGISFGIGVFLLAVCRALRNVNAPPLVIIIDRNHNYFEMTTRFNVGIKVMWKYILDTIFTVVAIGVLIVFVWRGAWVFIDSKVFPSDPPKTALASFIAGFTISILYALLQFPAERFSLYLSRKKRQIWKILFEQFYWLIAFFGPLNFWRGYWIFMDLYLLPEQPIISRWLTHAVGSLGLILLVNFKSVLVVGCMIDGSYPGGSGVTLPVNFIQDFKQDTMILANAQEVRLHRLRHKSCPKEAVLNGEGGTTPAGQYDEQAIPIVETKTDMNHV